MKDSSASTWVYVFTVLSAGSGLLTVVSIPVAGTGAPFVVGSLSLVLAIVAALFSERVSHGRFTNLGAFLSDAVRGTGGGWSARLQLSPSWYCLRLARSEERRVGKECR